MAWSAPERVSRPSWDVIGDATAVIRFAVPVLTVLLSFSCTAVWCDTFLNRSRWLRPDNAGYRIGIFLVDNDTVFDDFGSGWWQPAPYRRRGRDHRLPLRRATGQKQAKYAKLCSCFVFAFS